ncbi:hypothetical protein CYK37_15245 [Mesorhizobium loti]|nr:hypothetical protein [Mesorhizobium loti]PLP58266.1 hypothetical protein CYK37_15245 [Mesorhizobium loti]
MVKVLILVTALALAGCVSKRDGSLPANPRSIWCGHNSPRRDARADTPRAELNEINGHNARGEKWCGWKS